MPTARTVRGADRRLLGRAESLSRLAGRLALVVLSSACGVDDSSSYTPASISAAAAALSEGFPAPVNLSPDGTLMLFREPAARGSRLLVRDRRSDRVVVRHDWAAAHVSPTWRRDNQVISFLADSAGDEHYRLYLLDVVRGRLRRPEAPATTWAHPAKWEPDGSHLAYLLRRDSQRLLQLLVLDTSRDVPARVLVTHVVPRTGFAWSPDGTRIATITQHLRRAVTITSLDGGERHLYTGNLGQHRDLAWSGDGQSLLVTMRRRGDQHFRLYRITVADGRIELVPTRNGDVSNPFAHGSVLGYHVNVDSELHLFVCGERHESCHRLGPRLASTGLFGLGPSSDTLFFVARGRLGPGRVYRASLTDGTFSPVTRLPRPVSAGVVGPARVDIPAPDGLLLPSYVWRAPRRPDRRPALVLRIHGGPAVQATQGWDSGTQYLVRAGFDVLLVNYRGSTGFGTRLEHAPGGDRARVSDILAAKEYASKHLGIPPERITLVGHSYGARLAALASAADPRETGAVVLLSMVAGQSFGQRRSRNRPPRVWAFHGSADDGLSPKSARTEIERVLGRDVAPGSRISLRVFEGEGHTFQHLSSNAEVYATIAGIYGR